MEKRALLALILSILVLYIWDYYFYPKPQQTNKEVKEESKKVTKEDKESQEKISLDGIFPQMSIDKLTEGFKKWSISTNIYEVQILEVGARVFSTKLKKYKESLTEGAPPMELVAAKKAGYLPFSLSFIDHKDINIDDITYQGPSETNISIGEKESKRLEFSARVDNRFEVSKIYNFDGSNYTVDVEVRIRNISNEPLKDRLALSFYFLPYQENEPSYNESILAFYGNKTFNSVSMKDLKKKDKIIPAPIDWIGYQNNYFIQALIPLTEEKYQLVGDLVNDQKGVVRFVYLSEPFNIDKGAEKTWNFKFYAGPKELSELKKAGHKLVASVDYGWVGFIAKPLLYLLKWFYSFTHNYGLAIIGLTILVKIVCWPLTHKSYQSMQKMKKIQPLIAQLREKYKNDKEKLNQELLNLYRTYKVNPMGGCLPILLQIPIFFALYRMLYSAVELRHQPFCLWIKDLTAPDRLYVGFNIPYLGGIPVLTILMGVSMFIQQKMTPSTGDPRQDKVMLLMPVVFTVLFINFPSGLVLYWFVNNILSIIQQYWIDRTVKA